VGQKRLSGQGCLDYQRARFFDPGLLKITYGAAPSNYVTA
ncbi:uncharacterized protein METZ01_LOCUS328666, partial [marine metagenome]